MSGVTPQDRVKLIKRVAAVAHMNDIHTLQHELSMAEFDGWHRGWGDRARLDEELEPMRRTNDLLLFFMGWALGATLALVVLAR